MNIEKRLARLEGGDQHQLADIVIRDTPGQTFEVTLIEQRPGESVDEFKRRVDAARAHATVEVPQ